MAANLELPRKRLTLVLVSRAGRPASLTAHLAPPYVVIYGHHMSESKSSPSLPEIAGKIYNILEPLDAPIRTKVVQGAFALLGEPSSPESLQSRTLGSANANIRAHTSSSHVLGTKAQAWMRKHGLTDELLERVFDFNDQVELIGMAPGKNNREKTINAYVLLGAQQFLQNEDSHFSEAAGVTLCKRLGCFDSGNHAQTRTKFGNRFTGNKESGFTLTVPGLDQAAVLIKAVASGDQVAG